MKSAIVVSFPDVFSENLFRPSVGLCLLQTQSDDSVSSAAYQLALNTTGSVWTQLLTALVVGLLTALAFQFLLTNLGIAVGISLLAIRSNNRDRSDSDSSDDSLESSQDDEFESDKPVSHISTMAGFGILFTVNLVLFAACFLAAKFSQVSSPITGAIEGIVIWSAYFLLLLWISSTAVSSLVGSVLGATAGGVRQIVSTLTTALSSSEQESVTQAEMIAAIREETQAALEQVNLQQMIETQLQALQPRQPIYLPQTIAASPVVNHQELSTAVWQELEPYLLNTSAKSLTPKRVDRKLKKILQETVQEIPDHIHTQVTISEFDRIKLNQTLDQREDLTDKKKNRIVNQVLETWEEFAQNCSLDTNQAPIEPPEENESTNELSLPQGASQIADLLLKAATNPAVKQSLGSLPELLQSLQRTVPNWQEIAPIVLPMVLSKLRDAQKSDDSDSSESDDADAYRDVHSARNSGFQSSTQSSEPFSPLQQTLSLLADYSQLGLGNLGQALTHQVEQLQDRSMQQIESIQQAAQERIDRVRQQAQQRLENTRRTAATAAWWLFLTASTAALSSALAGAFATGWTISQIN